MATCHPYVKALETSSTSTSFTALTPTTTKPSGAGIFDLLNGGFSGNVPSWLQLQPYGTDGNNDTFDFRLYGYSEVRGSATKVYVPQLLIDVSVVLGNIAATDLGAGNFLADTLTINDGAIDGLFRNHIDCQEDLPASVIVHTRGCRFIRFDWDLAGAQEAATMNCLWRPLEI